jgi:hypothetical protein
MSSPAPSRAAKAAAIREHMVSALNADLIGPYDPKRGEELLSRPPSRWYLTGFLAPEARRVAMVNEDEKATEEDVVGEEELAAGPDDATTEAEEPKPKRRMLFPASLGLSVLLPGDANAITATVAWADYFPEVDAPSAPTAEAGTRKAPTTPSIRGWRRIARAPAPITLALRDRGGRQPVPDSGGLELEYQLAPATSPGLKPGTQALSLFLVNRRPPIEGPGADQALAFQVSLTLTTDPAHALVPRPSHRGELSDDEDERTADLQYREQREWAVGHGIAAEPVTDPASGGVTGVRTVWIPRATVALVQTKEDLGADVTLGMEALAAMSDGSALRARLTGLADLYGRWIAEQRKKADALGDRRRKAAVQLVAKANRARERMLEGIALLATDAEVRQAFQLANQAMADQARQGKPYAPGESPTWRPFQLAFLLLSLPSIADEHHGDRDVVELIFFPTGGGKTEAYLGLAAIILILRRLRGSARPDGGLGMAVLLRYTLRLLTLDQLGRAATLICALELLRQKDPARLGQVRFSLGLWVGQAATPNTIKGMEEKLEDFRNQASNAVPCPLTACPWCLEPLTRTSLEIRKQDVRYPEVRVGCVSTTGRCPFTLAANPDGVPVIFVDEQLYRELPGFVIATVDKLAMLPYRGETAALFGRVVAREGRTFVGFLDSDSDAARGQALPEGLLLPPDLIIQDELHLISGPLGTMVGLYEMAVDGLCGRTSPDGRRVRPKIVTSTATVRRARQQITALFGRTQAPAMFPPAGIDAADSFFGVQEQGGYGRLYVGVAAPGRASKAVLLRIYVALLTAAQHAAQQGPEGRELADAYMTLVGYFNSLRELGGMRRLVDDEVRTRCEKHRPPEDHPGPSPWFYKRAITDPLELTSRESTQRITEAKRQLALRHREKGAVDVALASNMISAGVDVSRLGLMVVTGQPKTTSEYIQATSRVGRDRDRPGLVVVAFNVYRPRDRSHYEHFQAYHEAFYANVEATSVTPFSAPALERGLAGALVALTRLGSPTLVPASAAATIHQHRARQDEVLDLVTERARACAAIDATEEEADQIAHKIRQRAQALFDSWDRIVAGVKNGEQPRVYSTFDVGCRKRQALLITPLEEAQQDLGSDAARFVAPTSMRDVEAPVHLWVSRRSLGRPEEQNGATQK